MTDKQEKILSSALELFAKEGYKATSTAKIAKHAGVSEGLIFRHYENKEGLLNAILMQAEEKAKEVFSSIIFETDPKKVIHKTIDLSNEMVATKEDAEFWKLQYKIKWEIEQYGEHKIEPLELALANAFVKLGYSSPELEAKLLLLNLDGLAMRFFLHAEFDVDGYIDFLHFKYK